MKQRKNIKLLSNVKEFAGRYKKYIVTSIVALTLGGGTGFALTISNAQYESNLKTIESVERKINDVNSLVKESSSTYEELSVKKKELSSNVLSLDNNISSLNDEILAKEKFKKIK